MYFEHLGGKIDFYEVEPEHTYNMDEKGFLIGAVGRQKRISSKRLFKKKAFKQMLQDGNREWVSLSFWSTATGIRYYWVSIHLTAPTRCSRSMW